LKNFTGLRFPRSRALIYSYEAVWTREKSSSGTGAIFVAQHTLEFNVTHAFVYVQWCYSSVRLTDGKKRAALKSVILRPHCVVRVAGRCCCCCCILCERGNNAQPELLPSTRKLNLGRTKDPSTFSSNIHVTCFTLRLCRCRELLQAIDTQSQTHFHFYNPASCAPAPGRCYPKIGLLDN